MSYVNFDELKRAIPIAAVIEALGIELKKGANQLRGPCPICQGGGERAFVVTPDKDLWYNFCRNHKGGGDQLELAARFWDCTVRDAALELQKKLFRPEESHKLKALEYLQPGHPAVQALGLPANVAEALGAGYASRGTMAGRILFPLRTPNGLLVAYIGYNENSTPILKLPTKYALE